jgi:dTDP-glucose pyrophosphorylase/predicted transcriptional regulator
MKEKSISKYIVKSHDTLWKVAECIENSPSKIALVIDERHYLVGTITDGDIRRALLHGKTMDDVAQVVMNEKPVTANEDAVNQECVKLMQKHHLRQIPIVDENRKLKGLFTGEDIQHIDSVNTNDVPVVIMAGGKGKRLRPLTEDCPKPMLPIGDQPLLELIIKQASDQGFNDFFISINYLGEIIKEHFGNGSQFNVNINYLEETTPLGTAGPLRMLKDVENESFIVINGDVLTRMYLPRLFDFHREHDADMTMCVREYEFQVPYGTVSMDGDIVKEIEEKPVYRFFVNAGIYMINKKIIELIDDDETTDMVTLLKRAKKSNYNVTAFPIHEYWMDIGRMDDLTRAREEVYGILSFPDY